MNTSDTGINWQAVEEALEEKDSIFLGNFSANGRICSSQFGGEFSESKEEWWWDAFAEEATEHGVEIRINYSLVYLEKI